MSTARRRHVSASIALLAMLAFALLPTLSRALAAGGGSAWTEICTPQGPRWLPLDGSDGTDGSPLAAVTLDHCALCSLATDGAAPLPALMPALTLPLCSAEAPPRFLQAAVTPHAWRSAQPRGPPARA